MNVREIKDKISKLPSGGITVKKIKNKKTGAVYRYNVYQWRENGRQKSRYLTDDEYEYLNFKISERKRLEGLLAVYDGEIEYDKEYYTEILTGFKLRKSLISVKGLNKREIISEIEDYVYGDSFNRIFVLFGLRRTGKTTMIKQIIAEMDEDNFKKAAYVQISPSNDLGQLNRDLKILENKGYKYIFIDEITLLDDFIEGAALLSDIYAASGMKIVLSGTDSLGFWITKSNQLYDRCILLHTTFIPYREFENVLGIKGIDHYIRFGGTMSLSGNHYNAFAEKETTDEYIDSAIAHNIQHSLKCYQDEGHFRHLYDLYEKDELTSAINRVVEDINHRFTIQVLTKEFASSDLALSARNEQTVRIDKVHESEIKEYLEALDLIKDVHIADIGNFGKYEKRTAFIQAGIRYSQAKALIDSLLQDEAFSALSFDERKYVSNRILNEIKGRMLEDVVLIETAMARPDREVFKLQFADGEFDMVVFDSENGGCSIYEIKYSNIIEPNQYRHLIDSDKIEKTAFRYGKVEGKYVLYRGETKNVEDIKYINVEEYLRNLILYKKES